ncbi:T9SS type A sorting domain-containing protein [Confluentibacter citreus]|uniref:T9SS type A sorting domain-containing protein n=1 Tax=Confluentibacter citreus TaxID=2007307 RepID=UPI000C28B4D4|nr:T9SS type A sorting domain-containing protein [Confluentibacter citreus]
MKKITLCLLFTLSIFAAYGQEITLIDFGATSTLGNWNNVNDPGTLNSFTNLIDDDGVTTGEVLTLTDIFGPFASSTGTQTPDGGLPFPDTATRDSYYGDDATEPTGGFTLSGLEAGKYYSFTIFASRESVDPLDNREALYTITGDGAAQTATLDARENTANVATILNVQPNIDGEITILVQKGSANDNSDGFYYIGAIEMTKTDDILSNKKFGINGTVSVFPNPSSESQFVKINLNLNTAARVKMDVYDVTGKLVKTLLNEEKSAGSFVQTWDRSNVASGLYILKIDADGRNQNSKLILK